MAAKMGVKMCVFLDSHMFALLGLLVESIWVDSDCQPAIVYSPSQP